MDVSRVSLRRYSIVICMTMTCCARNVIHFAAQAQRFVRSADCCAAPLGLAFGESLDVAVPLGFAFQGVASKLGFLDKSQLKWRFWWMGVCSEWVEIIPNVWCGANFVKHEMILSLFVAGAGLRAGFEVWKCDSRGRRRES